MTNIVQVVVFFSCLFGCSVVNVNATNGLSESEQSSFLAAVAQKENVRNNVVARIAAPVVSPAAASVKEQPNVVADKFGHSLDVVVGRLGNLELAMNHRLHSIQQKLESIQSVINNQLAEISRKLEDTEEELKKVKEDKCRCRATLSNVRTVVQNSSCNVQLKNQVGGLCLPFANEPALGKGEISENQGGPENESIRKGNSDDDESGSEQEEGSTRKRTRETKEVSKVPPKKISKRGRGKK